MCWLRGNVHARALLQGALSRAHCVAVGVVMWVQPHLLGVETLRSGVRKPGDGEKKCGRRVSMAFRISTVSMSLCLSLSPSHFMLGMP